MPPDAQSLAKRNIMCSAKFRLLVIISAIAFVFPTKVTQQKSPRTASPPIVNIELSGIEPAPLGVPAQLEYAGGAGGGVGEPVRYTGPGTKTIKPYWAHLPSALTYPTSDDYLIACGYVSPEPPTSTLIYPSGRKDTLQGALDGVNCWSFTISRAYGMELGLYTLQLDHIDGQLIYTWGIDYPYLPVNVDESDIPKSRLAGYWLMGYSPNELITLHFYDTSPNSVFIASRSVQVNSEGVAILSIGFSHSSEFSRYNIWLHDVVRSNNLLVINPPKYPSYSIGSCSDPSYGSFVETIAQNGQVIPIYSAFDDKTQSAGNLQPGIPAQILEQKAVLQDEHVVLWSHVQTEDGQIGWTFGTTLTDICPQLTPGGKAIVLPASVHDSNLPNNIKEALTLHQKPSLSAKTDAFIAPGTVITILRSAQDSGELFNQMNANRWWFIQTLDNVSGWLPQNLVLERSIDDPGIEYNVLLALPWSLTPVNLSAASISVCQYSPPTRLVARSKARITPGNPNNIRDKPEGKSIGLVPGGDQIQILEGPVCGSRGLTWWKIEYKGIIGWTAEGQGNAY